MLGECLQFQKIYHGKISNRENHVTIEEYIPGSFVKHLNNNGMICGPSTYVALLQVQKAEYITHYSYENSDKKIMLIDLQGSGCTLLDPEIASKQQLDENNHFLYCTGNLSELAINSFIGAQTCNFYCQILGVKPLI